MTTALGSDVTIAAKKAVTWGTAISVNEANRQTPILSESLTTTIAMLPDETLYGNPFKRALDTGAETTTGALETYLRYDGLDLFLGMVFGRILDPVIANKQPSGLRPYAYYGSYQLRDSLEGYFFTLAIDKQIAVHEYDSVKMNSMTISGDAGDRIKVSFDCLARAWSNSGTNSDISSATEPAPRKYVMFSDGCFRMKAQSGTALDGDDQFYPASFSITVNNNETGDITCEHDPYIDEPVRNAMAEVTGTLTIPRYRSTTQEDAWKAGTKMKMDARFISSTQIPAVGGGSYYYEFNMYMPQVQVTNAPTTVGGFAKIAAPFDFECTKADTAPDGMDGNGGLVDTEEARNSVTNPIEIEFKNVQKTNVLTV